MSDLHLSSNETGRYNQDLIIDALIDDLKMVSDNHLRPDCIIFSGDIVNSADDNEIFEEAELILEEFARAAGIQRDRVFLCPGNHDASRNAVGPTLPSIKKYRNLRNIDEVNGLSKSSEYVAHVSNVFAKYSALAKNLENLILCTRML
ncbi:metallophosphoesterase family protein [Novosphingobium capsulatum]|uniref:metallophosphoesterase family protein n=1 Tax=Novosphingobium capsulatum TaxID=13688 RepID=UPI002E128436|nr:metallophosphoesterase [Novosphingobium capsulatum]WQD92569.1 metallophosphoesterase [Novosphingobium capsulatum]